MIKRVRRRPIYNTPRSAKRGVVYLPKEFIGTSVKVLTISQYKIFMSTVKQSHRKIGLIRKLVYECTRA